MALTIHGRPKIDDVATPEKQRAWIKSAMVTGWSPKREFPTIGDDAYDDRITLLRRDRAEWRAYAFFLRGYIENMLFEQKMVSGIIL